MRFKRMGRKGDRRLDIPMLSGGLHTDTDPTLIADHEMTACVNMELRNHALRTRKALRVCADEPFFQSHTVESGTTVFGRIDTVCHTPVDIGGVMYAVTVSAVGKRLSGGLLATPMQQVDLVPLEADLPTIRYEFPAEGATVHPVAVAPCDAQRYNTPFLLYCNNRVYRLNGTTFEAIPDEELYAPLVLINGQSIAYRSGEFKANGVMYEGFNVLTRRYRAQFTSSVEGSTGSGGEVYVMPTTLNGASKVTFEAVTPYGVATVAVTVGAEETTLVIGDGVGRTVKATDNLIILSAPLPKSTVSGNVTITAEGYITENHTGSVAGATVAQWFGGTQNRGGGTRLFLTGFGKGIGGKRDCLMWSDVDNPLYFPQNNYMHIGDPSQHITALAKQEDMLVVFKEREMYYTRYVEGRIDADSVVEGTNADVTVSSAYFPLTQLSPQIGCDAPRTIALCRNRLVWMNKDGRIYTLRTAAAYSERNVREIGAKIRRRLSEVTTAEQRATASAADIDGRYFLMIGNAAFVFDYGDTGFVNQSSYSSDKRASQNIAWFEHHYPTLPNGSETRVISDGGDRGVVIATRHAGDYVFKRSRWYFEDGETDIAITVGSDNVTSVTETPIACSFTTKQYVFGDVTLAKRLKAVFLNIDTDEAQLRLIVDGRDIGTVRRLRGDGSRMQLVVPGVKRCQSFALSMTSAVPIAVKSVSLQYQNLDVTR